MRRGILLAAALLTLGQQIAQAEMMSFSQEGYIFQATAGNAFGLVAGDSVWLSGRFDASEYSGVGNAIVPFSLGSGNSFQLDLGLITLYPSNDESYYGGVYPTVHFFAKDGRLPAVGLPELFTMVGVNGSPVDFGGTSVFAAFDANGLEAAGTWGISPLVLTLTPEPGALTLAALGLVSVCGVAWRKRRTAA